MTSPAFATNLYVSPLGLHNSPFTSWANAATNIQDAVNVSAANDVIYVTNAVYSPTGYVYVAKAVTLVSTGGMATLNGRGANQCAYLSARGALDGFIISNGYSVNYGGAVWLVDGTLRNSLVTHSVVTGTYGGGGVFVYEGTISNCVISNNMCVYGRGGGVYFASGSFTNRRLVGCAVVNNTATNPSGGYGGGIYLAAPQVQISNCTVRANFGASGGGIGGQNTDVRVDGCVIENNRTTTNGFGGGGIYLSSTFTNNNIIRNSIIRGNTNTFDARSGGGGGGMFLGCLYSLVENCIIVSNYVANCYAGGGVYGGGGGSTSQVRNCFIAYNIAASNTAGAGIGSLNGCTKIENCTIVNNTATGDNGGGIGLFRGGAPTDSNSFILNSIIYYNQGAGGYSNWYVWNTPSGVSFTNCLTAPTNSMAKYTNLITADPQFVDWEIGNFRLSVNSPCIDAGTNRSWMTGGYDLDGNDRIIPTVGGSVDMGAYEFTVGSLTVTPYAVTNFLMQGNSILVPFAMTNLDTNYGFYWYVRLTNAWVQASVSNGYLGPGGTEAVSLTNNATGLAGKYVSRAWFFATNNPNHNSTSGRVDMTLNVNSLNTSVTNLANLAQVGYNATDQLFRVMSYGTGVYTFAVTTNNAVDWLVVTNGATGTRNNTGSNTVYLAYTTTALASGMHTGVLAVATTNGGGRTNLLYVVMNVMGLGVSPTGLANTVIGGFNATNQYFGVSAGGGSLNYTVSVDDGGLGWLNVNPTNGTVSGSATNLVTNIYTTAALATGEYFGQVRVVSTEGGGATGEVGVTLRVLPTPVIGVNPWVVSQVVDQGTSPTSDVFEVWNASAEPVLSVAYRVTVTNDAGNIIQGLSPADGVVSSAPAVVGISYRNLTAYDAGVYTAVVAVAMTNYGEGYSGAWSGVSNLTVVMVVAAPEAPGVLRATKGDYESKVGLSWTRAVSAVGGAVSYQILRHTTFDANYAQAIVSGLTGTNVDDSSALPGTRYYYWVRSVNQYGYNGTNSVPDSGYRRLSAPNGLFASDGEYTNKVKLSWGAVDGAGSYYVYRSAGGSGAGVVQHTAETEFEDRIVAEGVEYMYYVQATNTICGSVLSSGESGYVLGRPAGVSASDGGYVGKVVVSWGAAGGATAYEVWRSVETLTPPYGGGAKIKEQAATTYEDTSVTAGQKYYYWLKSKNATALSAYSEREEGYAALAAVDLSLSGLTVQPRRIGVGGNPAVVAFRLKNNGGANLAGNDGTVRLTFYASGNSVYGDGDETEIGSVDQALELGIGTKGIFRVGAGTLRLPGTAGNYYLFMRLSPVWPSTLAPSAAGGWVAGRSGALAVSPYGSFNYQAMNDYDGDGMSDLITHGGGRWDGESVDAIAYAQNYPFGGAGVAVMGDYDGDRKSDPVVYDASRGYWQGMLSGSAYQYVEGWFGGPDYRAVPGDYDGDGKTEATVYDTVRGLWYSLKVGDGRVMWELPFGNYWYEPVMGDYNGDGVWDLAVYDEEHGLWYARTVGGTLLFAGEHWGGAGFRPVAGDYNGDGIWDLAVYDEASGRWYIETAQGEPIAYGVLWGAAGFRPVAGDFDADGAADLAIYNADIGSWSIRRVDGTFILLNGEWSGSGRPAVGGVE